MIGALFKKQMMEVFSWVYQNKKSGKNRSTKGAAGYALLYLLIFGFLGAVFYSVAGTLCVPLASAGVGWLYFAIMGLLALFLGVFGSVFNTYASLYKSKDNDLLLAMPIPPVKILIIRLSGVYFTGLMYELIVMIPALIVWILNVELNAAGVICTLLIPLVLSVLALVFSALLGWLVALISNRLKRKNVIVVFLSLIFIALYYYCYGHAFAVIQAILANPRAAGERVRNILYLLYHMGLAAVCLFTSMNDISAPSISLEGKNLWLAQVFPVSGRQVLMAKLKLHLVLTLIPAAVLIAAVEWVMKPTALFAVLIPAVAVLFITVMAEFGLFLGVKTPNLHWTDEIVPIKQSMSVMICLFGGWALVVALAGGYYLMARVLNPLAYLIAVAFLLLVVSALLLHWLRTKGAKRFEELT